MKSDFTASWVKNRPAYWIKGKRVSRKVGYEHAIGSCIDLPEQFHCWHKNNK